MNCTFSREISSNCLTLTHGSSLCLPTNVLLNGNKIDLSLTQQGEDYAVYQNGNATMRFDFYSDCVKVSFDYDFGASTPMQEFILFADGVKLEGFDRAFSLQPRKNAAKNLDYYHHMPDLSANGYNSPPLLNLLIGSNKTWVGFGLLDLPDSKQYLMQNDRSIVVERTGGNKIVSHYKAPEMLITFPKDEWDGITLFREKLISFDRYTPKSKPFSQLPQWWKNPLICTYGDQLVEQCNGQGLTEQWVREFVNIAEQDWGIENMNLIIDSAWQPPFSFEPVTDTKRFPDMRVFSEDMHKRGHHVLLWCTPLLDNIANGFITRAQRLNVLSDEMLDTPFFKNYPGSYPIDYTADNAREFLHQLCAVLFGSEEGQWNIDGIKMDFLGMLRDPVENKCYANPERGLGIREMYLFLKMFSEEARKIKPDVMIDATTGDPRFESFITHNRLHDTHSGVEEKEMRAKIISLACPDLPIDTDGALMYVHWMRNYYISAAVYGIPSFYYVKKTHDFRGIGGYLLYTLEEAAHKELLPKEKKWYGTLFSMAKYKPDGHPVMDDFGNWRLVDENGVTTAASQRGDTVIYYPTEKNPTGYMFTLRDEAQILPLHGHKFSGLSPEPLFDHLVVDYARDLVTVHLQPGVIYTFKDEDDGTSIDRIFSGVQQADKTETIMDYVN